MADRPGSYPHHPSLALQQSLLTMEEIQSVEETQIKERKCLLLKIRGGKQFVLQCDVSGGWAGGGRAKGPGQAGWGEPQLTELGLACVERP